MRLWSFNCSYLDPIGLSRAINEGIVGYNALIKSGHGYPKAWEKHSQLTRFIGKEALLQRYVDKLITYKYLKDMERIDIINLHDTLIFEKLTVTEGQIKYEWQHYLKKLKTRNTKLYEEYKNIIIPKPHPLFTIIEGEIESWEKVIKNDTC